LIAKRFESEEKYSKSEKEKAKRLAVAQWLSTGLYGSQMANSGFCHLLCVFARAIAIH